MMLLFLLCVLLLVSLVWMLLPFWKANKNSATRPWGITIVLLLLMPVAAGFLYWKWGNAGAIDAYEQQQQQAQAAATYLQELKTPQAVYEQLQKVVAAHPNDAKGWFLLGKMASSFGNYAKANAAFTRAEQLSPNDADIYYFHAQSLFAEHDQVLPLSAKALLAQAMRLQPNNPEFPNLLALNAFYAKQYQQAIDYWTDILQHYPLDAEAVLVLQQTIEKTRALQAQANAHTKK